MDEPVNNDPVCPACGFTMELVSAREPKDDFGDNVTIMLFGCPECGASITREQHRKTPEGDD